MGAITPLLTGAPGLPPIPATEPQDVLSVGVLTQPVAVPLPLVTTPDCPPGYKSVAKQP